MLRVHALLLVALLALSFSPALAGAQAVEVVIAPGPDGVLLNATASYEGEVRNASQVPMDVSLFFTTTYYKPLSRLDTYALVSLGVRTPVAPSGRAPEFSLDINGSFSSSQGRGAFMLSGRFVNPNGTVTFSADGIAVEMKSVSVTNITVKAYLNKSMLTKEALKQLAMMELVLTPSMVNEQLRRQSNVTWVRFRSLELSHRVVGDKIELVLKASIEVNTSALAQELGKGVGPEVQELISRLTELRKGVSQNGTLRIALRSSGKGFGLELEARVSERGRDLEELAALQSRYLALLFTSGTPREKLGVVEPWTRLVVLPWNTSLKLSILTTPAGAAKVYAELRNLRIGYAGLKGDEATRAVAARLVSLLSALEKRGLPIHHRVVGIKVEVGKELAEEAEQLVNAIATGAVKPRFAENAPVPPIPLPRATRTATAVQTATATAVPTTPPPKPTVVTKAVPTTVTRTITSVLTRLLTTVLSTTVIKTSTVTSVATVTTTLLSVTTVERMSYTPIAIGAVVAIIGIAAALVARRRA